MTEALISTKDLSVEFLISGSLFKSKVLKAVDGISIDIPKGSFFGVVGESGSGKTTVGRALLNAVPIANGSVTYNDGEVKYDLAKMTSTELKNYRKRAQLIFQDPYAALSPRMTVRDIIAEPLEVMGLTKKPRRNRQSCSRDRCKMSVELRTPTPVPARFLGWPKTADINCAGTGITTPIHCSRRKRRGVRRVDSG